MTMIHLQPVITYLPNDDIIPFYYLQKCEFSRLLVDDIIPFYHPQYHESQGCKSHEQK